MALITIKDERGRTLVEADGVDQAIRKLAERIVAFEREREGTQRDVQRFRDLDPDEDGIAEEHLTGFRAGWKACQQALHLLEGDC